MALKDFIAKVRGTGLPTASHYSVVITDASRDVCMLADQINIPGLNIMTTEMRTFGEIIEMPYGINYDPVSISFIIDNTSEARTFLDEWFNSVFNRKSRTLNYQDQYLKEVTITLEDKAYGKVYAINLVDCYPKTMTSIALDYTNHDIVRVNVTLVYRNWTTDAEEGAQEEEGKDPLSMVKKAFGASSKSGGTIASAFSAAGGITDSPLASLKSWGLPSELPVDLKTFGSDMSSSISRSIASVSNELLTPLTSSSLGSTITGALSNGFPTGNSIIGNVIGNARQLINIPAMGQEGENMTPALMSGMNNLASNFGGIGSGISSIADNLTSTNISAPVSQLTSAMNSVSSTLQQLDGTFSAIGIKNPFDKIQANMSATANKLSSVTKMSSIPQHINSIGANMTALGTAFNGVSNKIGDSVPGSSTKLRDSISKLGFNFERQGGNTSNASSAIRDFLYNLG